MPNLATPSEPFTDAQYVAMMNHLRVHGGSRRGTLGFKKRMTHAAISLLVRAYTDLVLLSGGARLDDPWGAVNILTEGSGALGASWHGNLLSTLLGYRSLCRAVKLSARYQSFTSESSDGEMICRIFRDCGGNSVRGSSSRRAVEGLLSSVRELKAGANIFITLDGPRGPRFKPKGGALNIARLSGRPIIPVAGSFGRMIQFRGSWDHFELPLPFGCFTFHLGEPLFVPESAKDQKAEPFQLKLKQRMDEVTARAEREPVRVYGVGKAKQRKA